MRLVLCAEDSATNYSTNTTSTDEGSGAKSALPLATDVVCLPSKNGRDVGISCSSGKEHTGVANTDVVGEPDHRQTDERNDTIGDDPNGSNMTSMVSTSGSVYKGGKTHYLSPSHANPSMTNPAKT